MMFMISQGTARKTTHKNAETMKSVRRRMKRKRNVEYIDPDVKKSFFKSYFKYNFFRKITQLTLLDQYISHGESGDSKMTEANL